MNNLELMSKESGEPLITERINSGDHDMWSKIIEKIRERHEIKH